MAKKINWAHRYEAAWHECFWKLPEFKQIEIVADLREIKEQKSKNNLDKY